MIRWLGQLHLAKSLLEVAATDQDLISLDELAVPFSRHVCKHLKEADRQRTFEHGRFLDGCRFYNAGKISADELVELTVLLGFNKVLDAFHNVRSQKVPTQFFVDTLRWSDGVLVAERVTTSRRRRRGLSHAAPIRLSPI